MRITSGFAQLFTFSSSEMQLFYENVNNAEYCAKLLPPNVQQLLRNFSRQESPFTDICTARAISQVSSTVNPSVTFLKFSVFCKFIHLKAWKKPPRFHSCSVIGRNMKKIINYKADPWSSALYKCSEISCNFSLVLFFHPTKARNYNFWIKFPTRFSWINFLHQLDVLCFEHDCRKFNSWGFPADELN